MVSDAPILPYTGPIPVANPDAIMSFRPTPSLDLPSYLIPLPALLVCVGVFRTVHCSCMLSRDHIAMLLLVLLVAAMAEDGSPGALVRFGGTFRSRRRSAGVLHLEGLACTWAP